jgi:hypothetical protein
MSSSVEETKQWNDAPVHSARGAVDKENEKDMSSVQGNFTNFTFFSL